MPLIYNLLDKLEADTYITQSRREISDNNRVRIYYKITEKGVQYLNELTDSYVRLSDSVNKILFGKEENQ